MGFLRQEYWNGLPFLSPGEIFPQVVTAKQLTAFELPTYSIIIELSSYCYCFWKTQAHCVRSQNFPALKDGGSLLGEI